MQEFCCIWSERERPVECSLCQKKDPTGPESRKSSIKSLQGPSLGQTWAMSMRLLRWTSLLILLSSALTECSPGCSETGSSELLARAAAALGFPARASGRPCWPRPACSRQCHSHSSDSAGVHLPADCTGAAPGEVIPGGWQRTAAEGRGFVQPGCTHSCIACSCIARALAEANL